MPRTDVPPPGQGKRSLRKAWRDNADQTIAIYGLTAEETKETEAIEDTELIPWSHELPYWDDTPQPQPQSRSNTYTEEEVQEQVERAYQEGWQQGMEDGYKLGRDKGNKEYKVQQEQGEEEVKRAKKRANEGITVLWDTQSTANIISRITTTTQTDPAAPKARTSTNSTHDASSSSLSVSTATNDSQLLPAVHRDPTSSISPTASSPSTKVIEIVEIDHQAVPGDTRHSISASTATDNPKSLTACSRSSMSSIPSSYSSENGQIIETAHLSAYNTITSSNNSQEMYLDTENPRDDVSVSYIAHSDSQNAPRSNRSIPDKIRPPHTPIPKSTISDTKLDEATQLLVDVGIQEPLQASETSPDSVATSNISFVPPHLPPLPDFQLLNPTPYKRASAALETSPTLAKAHNDCMSPKIPTSHLFSRNSDHSIYSEISTPGIPPIHVSTPQRGSTSLLDIPSIVIHAQTVIINNYATANPTTISRKNGSTVFDKGKCQVPVPPATTPALPPRDFSVLRSRHHPFSSLHRRSRRRQSMPARGCNRSSIHFKDSS